MTAPVLSREKKRKNSSSGQSQNKRKRRGEVEEREKEEVQILTAAADVEERGQSSSGPSRSASHKDVLSKRQRKETDCHLEESLSDHLDRENEELCGDYLLREQLNQKYELLERLGEGGYGTVYAVYRRDDNLPMLDGELKELPLLIMVGEDEAIAREARGVSVELLEWYELCDELVLVMERPVPSMDLVDYIHHCGGHLKEEEAKVILRQLVEALIKIESRGILHRDIKPENILVHMDPEGLNIQVLDYDRGFTLQEDPYTKFYGRDLQ